MAALFALQHPVKSIIRAWCRLSLLALLAISGLAACSSTPTAHSDAPPSTWLVTFASTTAYAQALREITDHGLQPGKLWALSIESTTYTGLWQPQGQEDVYSQTHQLYIYYSATALYDQSLMDPRHIVALLPDAHNIRHVAPLPPMITPTTSAQKSIGYFCSFTTRTPPASTPQIWNASNDWLMTTVTFTAPLSTYDEALYTVSNLGLGLDSACNVEGSVGQEQSFAATHSLKVQTDRGLTSTLWLTQLRQTPGVASVASPTQHPPC